MLQPCAPLLALVVLASPVVAQSEAALKEYFEGRTVTVKMAMPPAGATVFCGGRRMVGERAKSSRIAPAAVPPALFTSTE